MRRGEGDVLLLNKERKVGIKEKGEQGKGEELRKMGEGREGIEGATRGNRGSKGNRGSNERE
jgi:hypothetical protein